MNSPADVLRRYAYALLIVAAVAGLGGRIVGVARVYEPHLSRAPGSADTTRGPWPATRPEPMPTHGDNDRSRWATVRALVEDGTYEIGRRDTDVVLRSAVVPLAAADVWQAVALHAAAQQARIGSDKGIVTEDGWKTIDKVLHPDTLRFYSSKPPLFPTLAAGEYWLLREGLGWEITDEEGRWLVVPAILLTFNALPWAIYLVLLAVAAERFGTSDWGRLFVVATGAFATFLTPFGTTLNNHTLAACSAMFALYPALRIWQAQPEQPAGAALFAIAGFFAGFTACTELPAAAFAAALFGLLLWQAPDRTLLAFVPAALVPVAAFFLTNYLAIGDWRPAYEKFGSTWYDYEGSYWRRINVNPTGIDAAGVQESRGIYAFHLLLGHHGVFALSPIFLLAVAGMLGGLTKVRWALARTPPDEKALAGGETALARTLLLGLSVTAVVLGFYIFVLGDRSRNYGGWTSGPRWLLWLTPLWLIAMLPAADWMGRRRWGRVLAYLLLAVSALSVSYPQYNPWRHPWLYNFLERQGVVKY